MENKIVVIGCGNVGLAYVYSLINQMSPVLEIVLIDIDKRRVEGDVIDLNHSLSLNNNSVKIRFGDYSDCRNATIVCITAGKPQALESRLDALYENDILFKEIIAKIMENQFNGIFLIASNPLDVMTYLTRKYADYPFHKVIGSGTSLDSARLQYILSKKLNVSAKSINAYVLGEHGDSQMIPWSHANIALQNIDQFLNEDEKSKIEEEVRTAGYEIIKRKGATYYGIAMALTKITNAILKDEGLILPVSTYDLANDIYMSMPAVIGREGIREVLSMQLTKQENEKLTSSIQVIKKAINSINNHNL